MSFSYIRATRGAKISDAAFEKNWRKARASGIKVGAYHEFSFCDSPASQFEQIRRIVPKAEEALPIAVDVEWYGSPSLNEQRCNSIANTRIKLRELAEKIEEYYQKKPILYGFPSTFRDVFEASMERYPVWLGDSKKSDASTTGALSLAGGNPWTLWQFSSGGNIPGVVGSVDVNAFFGTIEQFHSFANGVNVALEASVNFK